MSLAPATFTESVGLTYDPRPWFTQHVGIGSKQTVVILAYYRPLYNQDRDNPVRVELGLESRTKFEKEVFENVRVRSSLGLFAASLAAVRLGAAVKPDAYSWRQLAGAGCLAGIGFTMSLFIAGQAFPAEPDFAAAKIAVFAASVLSAIIGTALLLSAREGQR